MLAAAGHEAQALVGPDRQPVEGADLVIVDGLEDAAAAIMGLSRPSAADAPKPIATLIGLSSIQPPPTGLSPIDLFDGAIALDAPKELLALQLAAVARLGVAEEEQRRRRSTATALGVTQPTALEPRRLKAIFIGPPSPYFLALERTMSAHNGLVTAAFTSFTGFDHLHDEFFDAVVINGAQDAATAVSLCAALRRNVSLATIPTMVVTQPGDLTTFAQAVQRGASAVTTSDEASGAAIAWLFEAIRRERRRRAAVHEIHGVRDLLGEPTTGLLKVASFETHLEGMALDHHESGRPLALAALRVLPAHGAKPPPEKVWTKGFREIASLAARLMRDVDSGAAYGEGLIAMALPFTDHLGGRRAAERVASVAECTSFAAGDGGAAPIVFEQSVVELKPGESGRALLARARRVFDAEGVA